VTRIDLSAREWHELIKPVLPHASTDKEMPELGIIRLELSDTAVCAVATDRYTLAAERWPYPPGQRPWNGEPAIHVRVTEAKASLGLFPFSKDDDPPLRLTIDTHPVPIQVVGEPRSVTRLAITVEALDGTRLVLHDVRDPSRDPLATWRKSLAVALRRTTGRALEGLDISSAYLARWDAATRKGERLTVYTGPEPGDPLLILAEKHFAGVWSLPRYLDGPGRALAESPWRHELALDGDDDT